MKSHLHLHLRPFIRLAGAATLALLAACGGNSSNTDEPTNAGFVRLVNATPAALDLYDGTALIASAGANGATAYVDRLPETRVFNLKAGGGNAAVATLTTGVARQERYTIVAARSGNGYSAVALTDNEGAPSSGAKFRVYNAAASDVGAVDVYLLDTACAGLAASAAAPIAGGVAASLTSYTVISAGGGTIYHVCVTSQGDRSDLRLEIPAATFTDQQIVTLVLTRGRSGVLLDGLLLNQRGALVPALNTQARVRLAADTTAGTGVTASANGTALGQRTSAPAVGGYVLVSAGTLNISASIGGTTAPLVADQPALAGGDYTLLLTGTEAAPAATLVTDDNTRSTSTANPVKLRLLNGLNGATDSASLSYESAPVGSAAFASASTPALRATTAGTPTLVATFAGASPLLISASSALGAGKVYTVFLLGSPAAPVGKLVADR